MGISRKKDARENNPVYSNPGLKKNRKKKKKIVKIFFEKK